MISESNNEVFVSLRPAAVTLGVPAAWLRSEAQAGRVPHLVAGRRLLFNVKAVEAELLRRATAAPDPKAVAS